MIEEELPEGWEIKSFTEVLDIQGGTQPPKSTFIYVPKKDYIRLLQIRDFGEKPQPTFIPYRSQLKTCKADDILIARYGASIGRIVSGMEGAYNVALAKVIIPNTMDTKFVSYLLKSEIFQRPILSIQRSAQDGFNKDDLAQIEIPIAPLDEQKQIVAKLDALMERINANKTRLDKIPQILKRFRQSVLYNLMPGGGKSEVHSLKGLCKLDVGYAFKSAEYEEQGMKLLRGENIEPGNLRWNDTKYYPANKIRDLKHLLINENDIILAMDRPLISTGLKIAKTKKSDLPCILVQRVARFITNNNLDNEYLFLRLNSQDFVTHLAGEQTGTQIPHISAKQILSFEIELPPLKEQQAIVKRVNELFAFADKVEARYNKAKAQLDKLPQSILAKAFRGKLVPGDQVNNVTSSGVEKKSSQLKRNKIEEIKS